MRIPGPPLFQPVESFTLAAQRALAGELGRRAAADFWKATCSRVSIRVSSGT
jgi:hypothetical protein